MKKKATIISIVIVTILVIGIYLFLCIGYILYPIRYKDSIITYSQEYDVEKSLVASVINAESSFNTKAVSSKGAIGLMQLMPTTAKWLADKLNIEYKEEYLFEADYNIKLGTYYLAYLENKFNDTTVVLCAYNAGEGVVQNWLNNKDYSKDGKTIEVIPYSQTRAYTQKVIKGLEIYEKKLK